jgi:hypothetical protein
MDERHQDEDALKAAQDGRLYPVGRALRATYNAENHDTLGRDVTGLMINLSHIPYPGEQPLRDHATRDGAARAHQADIANGPAEDAGLARRLAQWWRRIVPRGSTGTDGERPARP